MKIGEKLTFVNFMKKITDGLAKIIFRQDVMGGGMGGVVGPGKCMRSLCHDRRGKRLLDCRRLGRVLSFFTFNNTLICKKDIFEVHP